jgi:DNA repair protein RecN (Recombination protein N)
MLALKTILAAADATPVLIFDEIDVNIGGETAVRVGAELRQLGRHHQVLCISHLAQVAARADAHFQVSKTVRKNRTFTEVQLLEGKNRTSEIARMLGGGQAALDHAQELLKS